MIAKTLAILVIVSLAVAARPKWHQLTAAYSFEQYVHDFGKKYDDSALFQKRKATFEANLKDVLAHNAKPGVSYRKGVNHMSDFTKDELKPMRGARHVKNHESKIRTTYVPTAGLVAAKEIDYRRHQPAVLTGVKDQGFCGDCWAFSVTEAIESAYALKTGDLYVLSSQQVTECTPQAGSCFGCGGSYPGLGFEYIATIGLTEEWVYGFEAYNGTDVGCRPNPTANPGYPIATTVNISGYKNLTSNNQADFEKALLELGPLSIIVSAGDWPSYESGIYNDCPYPIQMDHAVLAVGYGTDAGQDYWIVRNSWSPGWGEHGYIRLAKPSTPVCGENTGASYIEECWGAGPSEETACGTCGILFGPIFPTVVTN